MYFWTGLYKVASLVACNDDVIDKISKTEVHIHGRIKDVKLTEVDDSL